MHRARACFSTRARRGVAILTTLALAAGLAGLTQANAATTVAPSETIDGVTVVRNDSISLGVNPGAGTWSRLTGTQNFSFAVPNVATGAYLPINLLNPCLGNTTARNNSPRSELVVLDPDDNVILNRTSPVKPLTLEGEGQPNPTAAPADLNYLGGPWSTTLSLAGKPAGEYTVKTIITNKVKTGGSTCVTGTPNWTPEGALTNSFTPGIVEEVTTFVYRPWQEKFSDLLGTGTVQMNVTPEEFQFDVSIGSSPIFTGAAAEAAMKLYSVPNSFEAQLSLPNPGACGSDPLSCLPDTAVSCNPATGCQPRLATVNFNDGVSKLTGLFDLETQAFAAVATAGGRTRVLFSGGTAVDGLLNDLLGQLNEAAKQMGIDLPALLGTTLDLNLQRQDGSTDVIRISLLRALEIFNVPNGPATGIGLLAPVSVGAGVIVHAAGWAGLQPDPNATVDGVSHSGFGYTVTEATGLPAVPSLGPLSLLVPPGKLKHVQGRIPAGSGGHTVAIGADTDNDATTGLPLHLPLLSTPGLVQDTGIDFVGAATVLLNLDVCLPIINCIGGVALLGTGVATFGDNPLPVNFGSLPLVWGDELGLGAVMAPVDTLVSDIVGQLLSNPAVTDLLGNLPLGDLLPALPGAAPGEGGGGLPGLPGGLPIGDLPLGDLPLGGLPLGGLPLANLLSGLPLGTLPFGNLPLFGLLGNLPLMF